MQRTRTVQRRGRGNSHRGLYKMSEQFEGFHPDEIRTDEVTRSARLKWVIVIDGSLPGGRAVNASACVAATAETVSGLLARGGTDADGSTHQGLPWAGCTVLTAEPDKLRGVRDKAVRREDVFVADMPRRRAGDARLRRLPHRTVDHAPSGDRLRSGQCRGASQGHRPARRWPEAVAMSV